MELQDFKKPDLNAPRYRPTTFNPLSREFFKLLKNEHPHLKKFSEKQIRNIIKASNEHIADKIVELRDGVELPESLGNSFIGTCRKKVNDNPNFKLSGDLTKKVQYRNWESDNYLAKIFYTNHESKYKFKFHDLWTFKPCRSLKRKVAKTYPQNWKKYIQLEPTLHITRLYRKQKHKENVGHFQNELLKTYDEFGEFK